jgi:hypothetical protein
MARGRDAQTVEVKVGSGGRYLPAAARALNFYVVARVWHGHDMLRLRVHPVWREVIPELQDHVISRFHSQRWRYQAILSHIAITAAAINIHKGAERELHTQRSIG